MLTQGAFEKAKHYLMSQSRTEQQQSVPHPCITISRQTGAGADILSKYLLDYYNNNRMSEENEWIVYDKNIIEKVIEDHHLPKAISELLNEEKHSHIQTLLNDLLGVPNSYSLVHKTSQTLMQLAKIGNCIIIGRGSNIVTAGLDNVVHIRLIASKEDRIKHVMDLYKMSKSGAEDFMLKEDNLRRKYLQVSFRKDIEKPENYHMVLNTSMLSMNECRELVVKLTSDIIRTARVVAH
ncbi:MAG TPA: cytidylate kinase-like family protein [Ignavibacteriaceae bacterium]|nr:cytidylate kinase-like family protein [Ignavibacteriaceae bacterium]